LGAVDIGGMKEEGGFGFSRRGFMVAGAGMLMPLRAAGEDAAAANMEEAGGIIRPPEGRKLLLSVKLGMVAKKAGERTLGLSERLSLAAEAGFDGVDFDQAGDFTEQEVRAAVAESGVFVHNAINHAHWGKRLTSADAEVRAEGVRNIAHCIRVSHAAGGSGVLIVVGRGDDGPAEEIEERARREIISLIPLAASLGQRILFENVWNKMFYEHDSPPEQSAVRHVKFIDSFNSPWVGQYFDIGNHWKYGQPGEWIREFGHRCVKMDVKGYSREKSDWTDIGEGDLPWADVRKAIDEIGFTGWVTAEVGGGGVERLKTVREQMQRVFGI
jgi:L-ribulose-5-phosphate 3-epimerase